MTPRLFGAHMPTAGGLHKSLLAGKAIGCTAVQLFTASPRQWNHAPLTEETIALFRQTQEQTGMAFLVAHDSYLINLAAPDPDILERSRNAFRLELERAEKLGIPWVVTHMGSHLGQGVEAAIERQIESLRLILDETDRQGYITGIALETTAGQGTGLGWQFAELGAVLRGVGAHPRLGVCLDTCHIFAAGYDLRDEAAYAATWQQFETEIGLNNLKVIHVNDAKKPLGSRVDRHDHIGAGSIGEAGFARLLTDARFADVPFILETPETETMAHVNLARLHRLATGRALTLDVEVHAFGHYSDYLPEPLTLRVAHNASVADVLPLLLAHDARFADVEKACRFAVGEAYVTLEHALSDDCTLAVLPPMSGG